MCAEQVGTLESRQQMLRLELKSWERTFIELNNGRKAGKEDIKRNPEIAAKYKEYNKLRARISDISTGSMTSTPRKSHKRKIDTQEESEYPTAQHPALVDPYDVPQHMLSTPKIMRTFIGPTPQKNGQILGLFDMLSPASARTATPSRSAISAQGAVVGVATMHTPSKTRLSPYAGMTPSVSAKRRRLDPAQTPSGQRHRALTNLTPSSNRLNKREQLDLDQTPAFLKRVSDPSTFTTMMNELGTDITYPPPGLRLRRKPVGRSLSQLVRSLREQEDQRLDDEMALMREIETGETMDRPKIVVQDSQPGDLPLGADGEHELGDQESSSKENRSRTVWRKKGQKRTTRRANIGVNRAKWKPEADWKGGEENNQDEEETIPTTQAAGQHPPSGTEEESKAPSKKLRKINPNAVSHANFRSLKIKNKNSKGKRGGRFGRR